MSTSREDSAPKRLPAHPSVENLRKQAKGLVRRQPSLSLQQAQHQLAKSYGCKSWDELLEVVEAMNRRSAAAAVSAKAGGTAPAQTRRDGARVWIEPIPPLAYRKTGQSAAIASLAAALSVLDRDPPAFVTPMERVVRGLPPKTGPAWDYTSLMGDSAMAFRVRWHRRGGGRQTSEKPATWWAFTMAYAGGVEDEALLQRSTGWNFMGTPYFYPNNAKPREQWPRIIASIDAGLPVVATLPEEFGVIHGYDTALEQVLIIGYQTAGTPTWISIDEVGTKVAALTGAAPPASRRDSAVAALRAAAENWSRGDVAPLEVGASWEDASIRIQYGASAYTEWADDLRHADAVPERSRRQLREASAFNMSCLADARWAAAGYLRSLASVFEDHARQHLNSAAEIYERLAVQTTEIFDSRQEFFGVWKGQLLEAWTSELREKEATILLQCREIDAAAMEEIRQGIQ